MSHRAVSFLFEHSGFHFYSARFSLTSPYRWAHGAHSQREVVLVKYVANGVSGYGEIAPPPGESFDCNYIMQAGRQIITRILAGPHQEFPAEDLGPLATRVRCGVISAWLTQQAVAQNMPLFQLCAARFLDAPQATARAAVRINGLVSAETPEQSVEEARAYVAQGVDTLKVKLFGAIKSDLERVAALRNSFPDVALRIDPNGIWEPSQVRSHLHAFHEYRIEYVEDPLPKSASSDAMARIREQSPIKIALDEWCESIEAVQTLITARACDVLILKPQRVGGPDRVLSIASFAHTKGIPVTLTGSLESGIGTLVGLHTAAALPGGAQQAAGFGTSRFIKEDIVTTPQIENGCVHLSDQPGLGAYPDL